jgi:hypothetical protein
MEDFSEWKTIITNAMNDLRQYQKHPLNYASKIGKGWGERYTVLQVDNSESSK